jgi:hypothetical protein
MQFDTGSAIVYVLTDRCTEGCNSETKFQLPKYLELDEMKRLEYGYGKGYINGFTEKLKMSFSTTDKSMPSIEGVDVLVADQAIGTE